MPHHSQLDFGATFLQEPFPLGPFQHFLKFERFLMSVGEIISVVNNRVQQMSENRTSLVLGELGLVRFIDSPDFRQRPKLDAHSVRKPDTTITVNV